jgi:hypothetical protein
VDSPRLTAFGYTPSRPHALPLLASHITRGLCLYRHNYVTRLTRPGRHPSCPEGLFGMSDAPCCLVFLYN